MRVYCKDCKFWGGPKNAEDYHAGGCQLNPPQLVPQFDQTGRPVMQACFVTTKGDTWCGKGERDVEVVN